MLQIHLVKSPKVKIPQNQNSVLFFVDPQCKNQRVDRRVVVVRRVVARSTRGGFF